MRWRSLLAPVLRPGEILAGHDRVYATDRSLIVNRAKVARLSSVFTDKRIVGLAEARTAKVGTYEERFLAMLTLALGDPSPGDPLPPFAGKPVDYPRLLAFAKLIDFAPTDLGLQLFELRNLVARKRTRDHADADWQTINAYLRKAGQAKRNDRTWAFTPANPRDFSANLATTLGAAPDLSGLPEVQTVDDLYAQRARQDVQQAITDKLFLSVADFVAMMDLKRASDTDWRIINGLLQQAGRSKRHDPAWTLTITNATDFQANLNAAVGPANFASVGVTDIDTYADAIAALEQYTFMPAEQLDRVLAAATSPEAQVPAGEWDTICLYLTQAHRQKVFAGRRDALKKVRLVAATEAQGLQAIMALALGETTQTVASLEELSALTSAADHATLSDIAGRVATPGAVTAAQWDQAYGVLERAQRIQQQFPDPLPRKEEWLNLYAYPDATAVLGGAAPAGSGEAVRWKTFGAAPDVATPSQPTSPLLGIAIASPLFLLSGGDRQVTITLAFYDDGGGQLLQPGQSPFAIDVRYPRKGGSHLRPR